MKMSKMKYLTQDNAYRTDSAIFRMPKRKIGCTECFDETIELKLIKMIPSNSSPNYFLTTYRCPVCGHEFYDRSDMNEPIPISDEIQPVAEARKAQERYLAKLRIYRELEKETDEEKIKRLKQDKFYDPDFDPDSSELY